MGIQMQRKAGPTGGDDPLVDLVSGIATGDERAFAEFYRCTAPRVFLTAWTWLRCREDAEEVVCDVYLHAWQSSRDYDVTRGSVTGWLAMMARNRSIDRLRQRRRSVSLDDERHEILATSLIASQANAESAELWSHANTMLREVLQTLSASRRQLLELAYFHHLSHEEIARSLDMPLGTVKSHLRRTLKMLQATFSSDER